MAKMKNGLCRLVHTSLCLSKAKFDLLMLSILVVCTIGIFTEILVFPNKLYIVIFLNRRELNGYKL
jgi:hypothetical protein